jgi:hypothetical protein
MGFLGPLYLFVKLTGSRLVADAQAEVRRASLAMTVPALQRLGAIPHHENAHGSPSGDVVGEADYAVAVFAGRQKELAPVDGDAEGFEARELRTWITLIESAKLPLSAMPDVLRIAHMHSVAFE